MRRISPTLALTLLAAGCVAPPPPAPAPRPSPVARPAPPPPPAPAINWADRPAAAGYWRYEVEPTGSVARYGEAGAAPLFAIRCDRAAGRIAVARAGTVAGSMTLRGTTGAQGYAATPQASDGMVLAQVSPRDPQLDAMAFSRGRMLIGLDGASDLILPTWAEFTRVIEDCRG